MEKFNLYSEAFIFLSIFAAIIIVPCFFVTIIGRDMMERIGRFPTKAPLIQVKSLLKIVTVEAAAFILLTSFYRTFAG